MSRLSSNLENDPSTVADRIVARTSTADETFNLERPTHANRVFVLDAVVASGALQINLPKAIGNGDKFEIFNNAVQTQSVIVAASGIDVMAGVAVVFSQTVAESGDVFLTSATSDKMTLNISTTGGLRGDRIELIDWKVQSAGTGVWLVRAFLSGGGTLATPFTET